MQPQGEGSTCASQKRKQSTGASKGRAEDRTRRKSANKQQRPSTATGTTRERKKGAENLSKVQRMKHSRKMQRQPSKPEETARAECTTWSRATESRQGNQEN